MAFYIQLHDPAGTPFYWAAQFNVGMIVPNDASDPAAGSTIYPRIGPTIVAQETPAAIDAAAQALGAYPTTPVTTIDGRTAILSTSAQIPYTIESCGQLPSGAQVARLTMETTTAIMPPFLASAAALFATYGGAAAYATLTKLDGDPIYWWCLGNVAMIVANDANDPAAGSTIYPLFADSIVVRETPVAIDALVQAISPYTAATVTTVDGRAAIISEVAGQTYTIDPNGNLQAGSATKLVNLGPGTNCHVSPPFQSTVAAMLAIFQTAPPSFVSLTDLQGNAFAWNAASNLQLLVPIDADDPSKGTAIYPYYGDRLFALETVAAIDALVQALAAYPTTTVATVDGRSALLNVTKGTTYTIEDAGAAADGAPLSMISALSDCFSMPPLRKTVAQLFAIFGP